MEAKKFKVENISQLTNAMQWVNSEDSWDMQKFQFRSEIARIDKLRGEDFEKTFPELKTLLAKYERKKLWPV
jgi:predicted subunit of tRNA(5-methylaminomethyl-2-thiouridylate) methyltransferase